MKKYALAFVMMLGCTKVYDPSKRITLVFYNDVPASIQEKVLAGASYWRCVGVDISEQPGGELLPVEIGRVDPDSAAQYENSSGVIRFDVKLTLELDQGTQLAMAAHEIGHALGLQHVSDETQLMHHSVPEVKSLTAGDVTQFNQIWGTAYTSQSCAVDNKQAD